MTSASLRRALRAIDTATAGMSGAELARRPDEKWSASQILEHLALAFGGTTKGLTRCLEAGRPFASEPALRHRVATAIVVGLGYMPPGRQAPERTRPKGMAPEEVGQIARERLIAMDEALSRCEEQFGRRVRVLDHPILGPLSVAQWRKFHWVHTRHHMKQIVRLRGR